MLVVNYNGNKPINDRYKYSVQGNNNADVVRFVLNKKQGNIDLTSNALKIYVKSQSLDGKFTDKQEITGLMVDGDTNEVNIDWTLLAKHTANKQLQVALSFEDNQSIVWQTQLFVVSIANGIDSDTEIENTYPTIIAQQEAKLEDHEERIENLEGNTGGICPDIPIKSLKFTNNEGKTPRSFKESFKYEFFLNDNFADGDGDYYIDIKTGIIDERFEAEIVKGNAIIRLDYPICSRGAFTTNGNGKSGFVPNYLTGGDAGSPVKHSDILSRSFIHISSEDIKTNNYGEKYIYKRIRIIDILKKTCDVVDFEYEGTTHDFKSVNEVVNDLDKVPDGTHLGGFVSLYDGYPLFPDNPNAGNSATDYYQSLVPFKVTNNIIENNGIKAFEKDGKIRKFYKGFNPQNRIIFPVCVKNFQWLTIGFRSPYIPCRSIARKTLFYAEEAFFPHWDGTGSFAVMSKYYKYARFYHNLRIVPRLAILKENYESAEGSMFKKAYSQSKQSIHIKFSSCMTYYGQEGEYAPLYFIINSKIS